VERGLLDLYELRNDRFIHHHCAHRRPGINRSPSWGWGVLYDLRNGFFTTPHTVRLKYDMASPHPESVPTQLIVYTRRGSRPNVSPPSLGPTLAPLVAPWSHPKD